MRRRRRRQHQCVCCGFWLLLCCLCPVPSLFLVHVGLQVSAPAVVEEEAEILDLDAIFRRTTEEPALYWLPLTEEQAAARAAAKAKPSDVGQNNGKGPQQNGSVTDVKARP